MTVIADEPRITYAGFWWRLLAYLIDTTVLTLALFAVALILGFILGAAGIEDSSLETVLGVFGLVAIWLYFALMESAPGQATLGKRACGLKVTDRDGAPISFARASGRYFAKILSAALLLIGYLMVAFTRRKQGLHDIIAGTLVVRVVAPARLLRVTDPGEEAGEE